MNPRIARLPHVVYRCYDADDRLLYVGHTHDINQRLDVHRSQWGNPASAALNMRMVRHTEAEYPDKASAKAAEIQAIYDEAPVLNLHHQRVKRTPAQRYEDIVAFLEATRRPITTS